jgi:Chromosome segregation ATPases
MFVDALHFFQSNIKYKIEVGTFIKEESTASLVKIINGAIDMTDTLHTLRCSLQITSASILSSIIINSKGDDQDQASLKNLLFRFATNSMEGNTSSYTGALEYAMTQTLSRDLLRRALNFQAAFSYISGDDAFHIANILFSNAVGKSKSHSRLMKHVEQQQKDVETMYIHNQSLVKERDSLLKKLDRTQFSFDRELNIRLSRAKADAIGAIEAQTEEKKKLERMVSTLENELSTERESTKRALTDAREEREIANQKLKEYIELSNDLQNRISAAERKLNESNSRLVDADEKVEESKKALQLSLSENNELVKENNQVKVKLEKTLIQLISLTQIFTAKEQEHKSEQEVISREVDEAQASIEIEVQKRHQLEEKYSLVKGKYQTLKEKYEDVVRQRDEERSRYEQDLKRERKRRQEEEMKSKRKNDIRKPMGTIDFVNSFHDASMLRSDRGSKANKSTSSRIDRKSGRSSFRIMK